MQNRDFEALLARCDEEPIETPGAIQAFGALLAWNNATGIVQACSSNIGDYLGKDGSALLGKPISVCFPELANIAPKGSVIDSAIRPDLSGLGLPPRTQVTIRDNPDLRLMELERLPEPVQTDTHTEDPMAKLALAVARLQTHASTSPGLPGYLSALANTVQSLTGFERIMVYKFHPDGCGEVVAEALSGDLEPYLNLRYPASDIPTRARALYKRTTVRIIADVNSTPVSLLELGGKPESVDLSLCPLRSPSPVHLQYLRNMGVSASLVSSLVVDDELWGLIACHESTEPRHTLPDMRTAMSVVSSAASAQIAAIEHADYEHRVSAARQTLQRSIEGLAANVDIPRLIEPMLDDIRAAFDADGISVFFDEDVIQTGEVPKPETLHAVQQILENRVSEWPPVNTNVLGELLPDLADDEPIAGVLAARLASDILLILWRVETPRIVRWGGKPDKAVVEAQDGTQRLMPRKSFEEWQETQRGVAREWLEAEVELLKDFQSSFATLLIRQNEQLERLNRELEAKNDEMESFVYSVSHDLRGPIVTIKSFAGMALEDLNDSNYDETRDGLQRIAKSASKMSVLLDEMLELSRFGRVIDTKTPEPLRPLVESVVESMQPAIEERGARVTIGAEMPTVPIHRLSLERLLENLIRNALKYGCPEPGMEIRVSCKTKRKVFELSVSDDGPGIAPEHRRRVFALFQRMHADSGGSGIGLALVEKIAHAHGGSVKLDSDVGEGATFTVTLPKAGAQPSAPKES